MLDDPESFKTKEESKKSVLDYILQPQLYPDLYGNLCHVVRINYYPPRGDNKEGWDNIDLVGWLGYPMQLKINFLCRDSILAAPIVLDVALFLDLAKRAGMHGIQEWLSFYFKSPVHAPGLYPEHDLFIQLMKLKNTLRYLKGEELITHLGREYLRLSQVGVRQSSVAGSRMSRLECGRQVLRQTETTSITGSDRSARCFLTEGPSCESSAYVSHSCSGSRRSPRRHLGPNLRHPRLLPSQRLRDLPPGRRPGRLSGTLPR